MLLGIISPKINNRKVATPMAIPTPIFPNRVMAMEVMRTDIEMLTNSFPM